MELPDGGAEDRRVAANLAQRRQPQVAVERGVLDTLGHHRPAGLLEAGHELRCGQLGQRQGSHHVDLAQTGRQGGLGRRHGVRNLGPGDVVCRTGRRQVGPVDGERREDLDQGLAQAAAGDVEAFAGPQRHVDEPVDLGRQHLGQHLALGPGDHLGEGRPVAGQRLPQVGQGLFAGRIDEQAHDEVQRVVTGRAGAGPSCRQLFARLEDLLDHDVGAAGRTGQPVQIAARVGQTVGVIDPQPIDLAVVQLLQHQRVGGVEDGRVLDPHAGQGRDVEEPADVELLDRDPPVAEPIVLRRQRRRDVALDEGPGRDR